VLAGARVLVVGCGGVGSAIVASFAKAGVAEIALFRRLCGDDEQSGRAFAHLLSGAEDRARLQGSAGFDVVVNATPLGMKEGDPLPMDVARIAPSAFVGEVVMSRKSPVSGGRKRAWLRIQIGTDMLFEQIPAYLEFFAFGRLHRTSSGLSRRSIIEAASETVPPHRERDARRLGAFAACHLLHRHFEGNEGIARIALKIGCDIDAPSPGGSRSARACAEVPRSWPAFSPEHRRDGSWKPMGRDRTDLARQAVGAVEMQRINKNAGIRAGSGSDDPGCSFEIGHRGPRKNSSSAESP